MYVHIQEEFWDAEIINTWNKSQIYRNLGETLEKESRRLRRNMHKTYFKKKGEIPQIPIIYPTLLSQSFLNSHQLEEFWEPPKET